MIKQFFSSFFALPLALPGRRTELEVITVFATDVSAEQVNSTAAEKPQKNWTEF